MKLSAEQLALCDKYADEISKRLRELEEAENVAPDQLEMQEIAYYLWRTFEFGYVPKAMTLEKMRKIKNVVDEMLNSGGN